MRDERLILGFLLFHLLAAAPGMLLLLALGLVRPRPLPLLLATGPAFVTGIVLVGVPLIALVVLRVPVDGLTVVLALVAVSALMAVLVVLTRGRVAPIEPEPAQPSRAELVIERVLLAGTGVFVLGGVLAFVNAPMLWDDANIWSLKGLALFHHDGLIDGVGRNPQLSGVHLDYPILQPLTEATFFRAIGGVDVRLWHVELWLLMGALVWTMGWLVAALGRRWPWAFVLATIAASGVIITNITLGDADAVMAAYVGCSVLCFGIWLERGHPAHALLGAVLLAGAANVKNEGLVFGVAMAVALVTAAAVGVRPGRWRDLAAAAAIVFASVLPWQLWVLGNDAAERATQSPWQVAGDLGFLFDRMNYLGRGVEQIVLQLTNTAEWNFLFPIFIILGVALVAFGRDRTVAAFYLGAAFLGFLSVAYVYWVTPFADLGGFEERTGPRIVLGIVFIVSAGLAHMLHLAAASYREPEPGEPADRATEETAKAAA